MRSGKPALKGKFRRGLINKPFPDDRATDKGEGDVD
jgi:hypothetical protein